MFFSIDPNNGIAIYEQIVRQVKFAVADGVLIPGQLLPSVRTLSVQLAINPNTVAKAYAELTTEGWLEARQGMGLYVATPRQRLSDDERERRLDDAIGRFVNDVIPLGFAPDEVESRVAHELQQHAPRKRA